MTHETLTHAVELSLRVLRGTATDADKRSLQIFLAYIGKREERAYCKALNAACEA